jgi:phage-related protein
LIDINRKIVFYKNYFIDFYEEQDEVVQRKIDWTILLIKRTKVVPDKFMKKLKRTDGLWEIRVSANKGIFRIFCFFDKGDLIVLINGFKKKTQKTPTRIIKAAERLKKEYYENK